MKPGRGARPRGTCLLARLLAGGVAAALLPAVGASTAAAAPAAATPQPPKAATKAPPPAAPAAASAAKAVGLTKAPAAAQKPAPPLKNRGKIVPLAPGRGPRVSLDARDIDVRTVLAVLSGSSGARFRIAPEVRGTVSYNRRDLALEDMLDAVLPPLGLRWTRLGSRDYRIECALEKQTGKSLLDAPRGWDRAGLRALYYNDTSCELADGGLSALLAVLPEGVTPATRTDARPGGVWGADGPAPKVGPAHWSARWTGRVWVPADDAYTFAFKPLHAAALLLLDGKVVLDAWQAGGRRESFSGKPLKLSRGWHDATIEYHQKDPEGALGVTWQAPWLASETIGLYRPGGTRGSAAP